MVIASLVALGSAVQLVAAAQPPVTPRPVWYVAAASGLLLLHAGLYALGGRLRYLRYETFYLCAQVIVMGLFALVGPRLPVPLIFYVVFIVQASRNLSAWTPARLTLFAAVLLAISTAVAENIVRALIVAGAVILAGAVTQAWRRTRRPALNASIDETDDDLETGGGPATSAALTERELEVLRLAAKGATARKIAERLGISERRVEFHLSNVYEKLGVQGRAAAAATAAQYGML